MNCEIHAGVPFAGGLDFSVEFSDRDLRADQKSLRQRVPENPSWNSTSSASSVFWQHQMQVPEVSFVIVTSMGISWVWNGRNQSVN